MSSRTILVNNSRETFTTSHSGAIATCLREIALAAAAGDEDVAVVSRDGEGVPVDGLTVTLLPAPRGRRSPAVDLARRVRRRLDGWARPDQRDYAGDVLRALRGSDPERVIVNNDPEVAVVLARALPGTEIVHWFHNLEMAGDRFRRRFAVGRIRSVAVSRYLARAVEGIYGLPPLSVSSVLNGADATGPSAMPDGPVTIGFVGRIAVEKGVDVLLAACRLLAETRSDFRLQLVGDTNWGRSDGGPYGRLVEERVGELRRAGIEVVRTGHLPRDGVADAIRATTIHVVPSRWDEPCGLTTLEGLALGRVVVASATGGSPEVVQDAGVLFPREDPAALARSLSALLDDPARRVRLAERARERAAELTWRDTWLTLAGRT